MGFALPCPSPLADQVYLERQKATRGLKKLRTQLASTTANTPEYEILADRVHCAEVDLNYTLYHPLTEKYVGLFPRQEAQKGHHGTGAPAKTPAHPRKDKPAMWTVVEACMANGTLQALRDGKLQMTASMPLRPQGTATTHVACHNLSEKGHKASATEHLASPATNEYEDIDDGGFFEERW